MRVEIRPSGEAPRAVPATLLGQNLEMCLGVGPGLASDRLDNPKFMGPANPDTGLARGWMPAWNHNFFGTRFELTPGMFLSGTESQLIHNYSGRERGILQINRTVRGGERLEVSVWAVAQYHPVTLRAVLRPLDGGKPIYAETTLEVTQPYWKEYTAELTLPAGADDDAAVFGLTLPAEGMVWLDQVHLRPAGMGPVRTDVLERLATVGMPVLRFPGGCISTAYHWRCGTGPHQLRPELHDPMFKFTLHYEFGTDEYLAFCHAHGMTPHITVNIGSGSVEEAAGWARYVADWYRARGVEPLPAYWQIGNEHYGAWEIGSMTGAMYVEVLRAFVPAIKAEYPNARIIALGPETGELMMAGQSAPWRAPILEQAADLVDVLAIQYYCGGWHDEPVQRQAHAMNSIRGLHAALEAALADIAAAGADIRVAMTEWNMWQYASHHDGRDFLEPADAQHALFAASVLNGYARLTPGLELANFYNLFNVMGHIRSYGPEIQEWPVTEVFRLYRPAFPGELQPVTVDSPVLEGAEVPAVDAACLRNDDGTWLFLVNRSVTEAATVAVDGMAGGLATVLQAASLTGDFTAQEMCFDGPELSLPPMSVARVKLG